MTLIVNTITSNTVSNTATITSNSTALIIKAGDNIFVANSSTLVSNGTVIPTIQYVILPSNIPQPSSTIIANTAYLKSSYTTIDNIAKQTQYYPYVDSFTDKTATNTAEIIIGSGAYGNGYYVMTGSNTQSTYTFYGYATSGMSWNWYWQTSGNDAQNSIAYGNGWFVSVKNNILRATIPTGSANWTLCSFSANTTNTQHGVAYGNGVFVSVGNTGTIASSSNNGATWTYRTSANTNRLNDVTYATGIFVAVGNSGTVQTSTDGTTWTNRTSANSTTLFNIIYGNGIFVATSNTNQYQTSTDAITWVSRTFVTNINLNYVIYGEGLYVGLGYNSTNTNLVYTSTNAIDWSFKQRLAPSDRITGSTFVTKAIFGNSIFVLAGSNGSTYSSSFDYNTQTHFKIPSLPISNTYTAYVRY